jgi:hypothetical protein
MTDHRKQAEQFLQQALPIGNAIYGQEAVLWLAYHGELLRLVLSIKGHIDVDIVEPDTPAMDELLQAVGADALLDGIRASQLLIS